MFTKPNLVLQLEHQLRLRQVMRLVPSSGSCSATTNFKFLDGKRPSVVHRIPLSGFADWVVSKKYFQEIDSTVQSLVVCLF